MNVILTKGDYIDTEHFIINLQMYWAAFLCAHFSAAQPTA